MTLEELHSEKKRLDNTIPSTKNIKYTTISVLFLAVTILLAAYAMKDSFSYILTGLVLLMVFSFVKKIIYVHKIVKEIKSR
ncbi:MAG: hypothetical protein MUF45_09700 [Spirosomaceae bacterium]|nr:hypothetical protein [Spirosomataceae bacterium]